MSLIQWRWLVALAALLSLGNMGNLMSDVASAENVLDRYERDVYASEDRMLPYRLLRPARVESGTKYPLVLFFHGAGERGTDNQKQLVHGMSDFASDDVRDRHPCYVVAPQCPDGMQWVDTPWTGDSHVMPEEPTPAMAMSLALIDKLSSELPIDADRVYVTGLSMGGFGAWDAVQRRPGLFAAVAPICGGGDAGLAARIAHIPAWVFHGDSDSVVKPQRSRDMVAALQAAGGRPRYTEYPNTQHNSWAATYANRELYAWLFAQRRRRP